ncbi:MAG: 16S rRNA (cytosine(1402)-N(4))-methyltransferase RsmH [Oligoflexia bacterium]|nr:16S rRNA (cytosine(1402)-N(4))-methyltransferase RsmH [Oligoflexia bacterium]
MTNEHVPVLEKEVLNAFIEQTRIPKHLFEGTFGRGGHTKSLLNKFVRASVTSFDKDAQAIAHGKETFASEITKGKLTLVQDDFKNLNKHKLGLFDGALLDLGVSSPQFDQAERGFSFMNDGPLDMRMDQTQELTAAKIINEYSEKELSDLFYHLGEVRKPNRVVRAVVHDRKEVPFTSTRQLASLIERVDSRYKPKRRGAHPATNYFMGLRIAVNSELEGLVEFCEEMHLHMEPGSRFVVISFHSLEDRIIKQTFKKMNYKFGKIINKKVIIASDEEIERNPRSRSAKMRIFEMGGHE